MKNVIFFLLFCCWCELSTAQSVFATDNAEWYHQGYDGIFHAYVAKDTIIQGVQCRKIVQDALQKGPMYYDAQPMFVYTASDTTFIFNTTFNRFTPLYIFNAQEGDSICLPIIRPGGCASWGNIYAGDSTFCFVVDSIRMVRYDTALLKTFYTQGYQNAGGVMVNWGNRSALWVGSHFGAYVERVGCVKGNIIPYCWSCARLAMGGCQDPDSLRCYSDTHYSIKMVSNDCNDGIAMSISEDDALYQENLKIFPTPATDYIYFDNQTGQKLLQITIYSTDGKLILTQSHPHTNRLSTEGLADGIYYLRIGLADHMNLTKKVLIQKN